MERPPLKQETGEGIEYPTIAQELIERMGADQAMRIKAQEQGGWDETIDKENTERLKTIIEEIGWPTISKVGAKASHAAWLIAQHADHDREFQRACLGLLTKQSRDEIQPKEIGFLTDRVRVAAGNLQLYGTQFWTDDNGVFGPRPIEDVDSLDQRRDELGMQPFSEYMAEMLGHNVSHFEDKKS